MSWARWPKLRRRDGGREIHHPAELALNEWEQQVLAAVPCEPTTVDAVIAASGLPAPQVLATLQRAGNAAIDSPLEWQFADADLIWQRLSRRPLHGAAAEEVEVQMIDGLAAVGTVVDDHAVAFFQTQLFRKIACCDH